MTDSAQSPRPLGISSRARVASGPHHRWRAGNGELLTLPIIIDYVVTDGDGVALRIEAIIDVRRGQLITASMNLWSRDGLDVERLQREFRWRTPLEIAGRLIPRMLAHGRDPYGEDLPVSGFPEAASGTRRRPGELSDEFLAEIAAEYLRIGRGYARRMALERDVSPRTVVSWVVKARQRGILTPAPGKGRAGGQLAQT